MAEVGAIINPCIQTKATYDAKCLDLAAAERAASTSHSDPKVAEKVYPLHFSSRWVELECEDAKRVARTTVS